MVIVLLGVAMLLAVPLMAQQQTGVLSGTVALADGSRVPGALVRLPVGGSSRVTMTDENGNFRFSNVPPGRYPVTVELEGFNTSSTDVSVSAGQTTSADMLLETATIREEVIVVRGVPQLVPATAPDPSTTPDPVTTPEPERTVVMPPLGADPTPYLEALGLDPDFGRAPLNRDALNFSFTPRAPLNFSPPRAPIDVRVQLFILDWANARTRRRSDDEPGTSLPRANVLAPGTRVRLVSYSPGAQQRRIAPVLAVVANGESSGEAFELQVLSDGDEPIRVLAPDGLVLQAIREGAATALDPAAGQLDRFPLIGFCLEYAKPPPTPGTMFQVAPRALQDQYRALRAVLRAGRELAAAGRLNPDSEPSAYATSIRQWALWTRLEGWDQDQFTDQFVAHTKKNAEANNIEWTSAFADAMRRRAPNRFEDILAVLQEADQRQ